MNKEEKLNILHMSLLSVLKEGITFSPQTNTYLINQSIFDWIDTKILEENIDKHNKIIKYLTDCGIMEGDKLKEKKKPDHGSCCTCQNCGYNYDNCICNHNEHLKAIKEIFEINND